MDAFAAVRMAEVWSLFGPPKTSANEMRVSSDRLAVDLSSQGALTFNPEEATRIDFYDKPVEFRFTVGEDMVLDHVDLTIEFMVEWTPFPEYTEFQALNLQMFKLIAPDGTEAFVDTLGGQPLALRQGFQSFTFGLKNFRGTEAEGEWTFQFQERYSEFKLTIGSVQFDGYGSAITSDDVHSYTDEFFAMAAIAGEDGRRTLSDTNGGVDWVNAAAVTADVALSLLEGATTRFGDRDTFTIARGSRIENAVTGDGNDRLIGNVLDNRLYGMRGNDWLNGGAGNDTLFGGQGNDVFAFDTAGVSGRDKVLDWSAGDRIATSKMLRGADQNGVLTVGSSALLLLDGNVRGDTAELEGQGGATLRALGRSDGYWWYGFLTESDESFVDGRVTELALGQTGRPAGTMPAGAEAMGLGEAGAASSTPSVQGSAFYLYDTMGEAMVSGVQTWA